VEVPRAGLKWLVRPGAVVPECGITKLVYQPSEDPLMREGQTAACSKLEGQSTMMIPGGANLLLDSCRCWRSLSHASVSGDPREHSGRVPEQAQPGAESKVTKVLAGCLVIDDGSFITGPYAAVLLADLGAEVIKVERPGTGDPFRSFEEGL
jgi:CoA-transferase family III